MHESFQVSFCWKFAHVALSIRELGLRGQRKLRINLLVCLRADVSYFLCCSRKRDICVTSSLIVFQRPAGFPRSWEHAVIG